MFKIKWMFILLLICTAQLLAQQLSQLQIIGKPEKSPTEFVSSSIKDANGRVCAAIQVISDLDGFQYDSYNGVVEVNHQPGRDMVYLQPDERVLEILHSGYEPLKIILSELGINLESKAVWKFRISGDKKLSEIPIAIIAKPEGAEITLDGKLLGVVEKLTVSTGMHQLGLKKEGFEQVIQTIIVDETNTLFKYELQKIQDVPVEITTEPTGADVSIDHMKFGTTPLSEFYPSGKYPIRIEKEWYVVYEDMLEVSPPRTSRNIQLRPDFGSLKVTSTPQSGLELFIDGQSRQVQTPHTFERLKPGIYQISAKNRFYETAADTVEIIRGGTREVILKSEENFATLTIKTLTGASVYLNGERITELVNIRLEPMVVRIRVEKPPKGKPVERQIMLKKGEKENVEMYPEIPVGTIQVAVIPLDAKIELKGDSGERYQAERSNIFQDIPVGVYTVRVSRNGYKSSEQTVSLKEGAKEKLSINLAEMTTPVAVTKPKESVLKKKKSKWLYYTIGVCVVGGGIYFLTKGKPKTSTLVIDMPDNF